MRESKSQANLPAWLRTEKLILGSWGPRQARGEQATLLGALDNVQLLVIPSDFCGCPLRVSLSSLSWVASTKTVCLSWRQPVEMVSVKEQRLTPLSPLRIAVRDPRRRQRPLWQGCSAQPLSLSMAAVALEGLLT